jgi:hypothetical protein
VADVAEILALALEPATTHGNHAAA